MKTRDLHDSDLDSIWTPEAICTPSGLHNHAEIWRSDCLARGRKRQLMFVHGREKRDVLYIRTTLSQSAPREVCTEDLRTTTVQVL